MTTRSSNSHFAMIDRREPAQFVPRHPEGFQTKRQSGQLMLKVVLGFGLCLFAGCGPSGPELVPVNGTVSLDGEPLPFKSLMFIPEGETAGNGAGGYTNGEGSYSLIAVIFGATKDYDGCPPGRYRVVVSEPSIPITAADFGPSGGEDDGDEPAVAVGPVAGPVARGVPTIYTSEETTTLILEVPDSGGVVDVELTSDA